MTQARPVLRLLDAGDVDLVATGPARVGAVPAARVGRLLDGPVSFPAIGLGQQGAAESLADHVARLGCRHPGVLDGVLVDRLADAGLTGRGGAHFPTAAKWRAVRAAARRTGRAPIVVANGAEGEPASAKDAALITRHPHLVLDGLVGTAEAVGATECVVWLHGDATALHRSLTHALLERRGAGLVEPVVRLASGSKGYLSGESSAVVRGLSGGPALPELRRQPAAVNGVDGRPTLVHNVETLAHVGLLGRDSPGDDWPLPGGLVTVLAGGWRTVVEVDGRTTVLQAVLRGGWPVSHQPQALLMGGYGGTWLPWGTAADLVLDQQVLNRSGHSLGAGVLALLPQDACGIAEASRVADYLARSSARQCGPCLFGLPAIGGVLADLRAGRARRRDLTQLQRWAGEVHGRGACHHPDGAVRMALSALTTFAADAEAHRRRRPCAAAARSQVLPVPDGAA